MLKKRKTTSSGTRHQTVIMRKDLHKGAPEKSLLVGGHVKRQGRGYRGHITVRHRGGGSKRRLRTIEWRRRLDVPATVVRQEYDPNRSANVLLLQYADGFKSYILSPEGVSIGQVLVAGEKAELKPGHALPLSQIPVGMTIHNLELTPGKGAQLVRGAGAGALIQSKENGYATVLLPSKEVRLIKESSMATIGQVGNIDWKNRKIGKAGRNRLMGIRPTVRGTAQHPGSHPHGGGEGRSGVGLKYPKTPWGKHAHGTKTRRKKQLSSKYIVRDRRARA